MPQVFVGCDLSRAFIDVCCSAGRTTLRIDSTKSGLKTWLENLDAESVLVFEATSGCGRLLMEALNARGMAYAKVNPRQAREFARANGMLAKTNEVDARGSSAPAL